MPPPSRPLFRRWRCSSSHAKPCKTCKRTWPAGRSRCSNRWRRRALMLLPTNKLRQRKRLLQTSPRQKMRLLRIAWRLRPLRSKPWSKRGNGGAACCKPLGKLPTMPSRKWHSASRRLCKSRPRLQKTRQKAMLPLAKQLLPASAVVVLPARANPDRLKPQLRKRARKHRPHDQRLSQRPDPVPKKQQQTPGLAARWPAARRVKNKNSAMLKHH